MKLSKSTTGLLFLLLSLPLVAVLDGGVQDAKEPVTEEVESSLKTTVIDNFSYGKSNEKPGAKWQLMNDRAMGGASRGRIEFGKYEDRQCLRMTGSVSGGRNDGFIQARFNLISRRKSFDAGTFKGVKVCAKGNGRPYAVLLQTKDTRLRWQYYEAAFATNGEWQEIEIPFAKFMPKSLNVPLDTTSIRSIAGLTARAT